jgi:dTDP-N-acetylfucosamine:lipid II N-acetylfucosaminyltransferase
MMLHLLSEPKFDSLIMDQIEECCPGENLYMFFSESRSFRSNKKVSTNKIFFQEDLNLIDFSKVDGILIHYLSIQKARLLAGIPDDIPLGCSLWGGDFYNFLPELRRDLFGDLTKRYVKPGKALPPLYFKLKDKLIYCLRNNDYHLWKRTLKRSKIFSTIIPYERSFVEKYTKSGSSYVSIPVYSLDKVLNVEDFKNTIITKENFKMNILIGNSGHITNNHLEILHFIKSLDKQDINIHAPLTYGNDKYIKHICATGSSLFGNKFFPLLDHLNNKDYLNFLNRHNLFIFNSYRQQGIGTIVQALWTGGKVFLSNRNITISFYRDKGLKVFSIEDDLFNTLNTGLFEPLTRDEIFSNREKLLDLYAREKVNNSIRDFLFCLKSENYLN